MGSFIPEGYESILGMYDTQKAIGLLNRLFQDNFSGKLHLRRVSAPLFVDGLSGLNDNLNGVERPVQFDIPFAQKNGEVVHSLAKWKRLALHNYNFFPGNGLYTDMNAIRRDEDLDNLHSIYVDQWDWEKVINPHQRTLDYLKSTVMDIADSIYNTCSTMCSLFPVLTNDLEKNVSFITSQELEDLYPDKTPKEREYLYTKEHHTVFIMQIGKTLRSGNRHDGRAPDYDDWDLNGDLLYWHEPLGCAMELSSMGIRVSPESLDRQLSAAGCDDRRELFFHSKLLKGELPLTIGGGIGQSRMCMLLLKKAHIGEVQSSIWDDETIAVCEKAGVKLL